MDALPQPYGAAPNQPPPARVYLDFYQLVEAPFASRLHFSNDTYATK